MFTGFGRGSCRFLRGYAQGFFFQDPVAGSAGHEIRDVHVSGFPNVEAAGVNRWEAAHDVVDGDEPRSARHADNHDSISRVKKRPLNFAMVRNYEGALALSLLRAIGGKADDGKLSHNDRDGTSDRLGFQDAAAQLNLCRRCKGRRCMPAGKVKGRVDSIEDIRGKDFMRASDDSKRSPHHSLKPRFHGRRQTASILLRAREYTKTKVLAPAHTCKLCLTRL